MYFYTDFFKKTTGNTPYPYQEKVFENLLKNMLLKAPTGAGKTAAIIVAWLYRRKVDPKSTPKRLVILEPMRTLVGQVFQEAQRFIENAELSNRISVHLLMGGCIDDRWAAHPQKECIIVGTQDQILSRQLNRGYCCSRWQWPIHAAFLNQDCLFFVDETQLMGAGYSTTVQLQKLRETLGTFGNSHTIWSTATPDTSILDINFPGLLSIAPAEADYAHPNLYQKLTHAKALQRANTQWRGSLGEFATSLATEIIQHHQVNTLTLVVLNTVKKVNAVRQVLSHHNIPSTVLHSRFRKADRANWDLNNLSGVILATQVIEAGVDIDARLLFTDLCPWASFVQRAGRCGRRGLGESFIYWIDALDLEGILKPYEQIELQSARQRLQGLTDASIKTLLTIDPPPQPNQGKHLSQKTLHEFFDNHPSTGNQDVAPYVRDAIYRDLEVAWRNFEGHPPAEWQILDHECCPVTPADLAVLTLVCWIYSAEQEQWVQVKTKSQSPGTRVLVPCAVGGYATEAGYTGNPDDIPLPIDVPSHHDRALNDFTSHSRYAVTLAQHSEEAAQAMESILIDVPIPKNFHLFLIDVANWHDLGKVHPVFQQSLAGEPYPETPLAKSAKLGMKHSRPMFRHELASALAALHHNKGDLFAYLVLAHHGKVRTRLDAYPWVKEEAYIFGISKNDKPLKATNLGRTQVDESNLSGISDLINTWYERQQKWLNELGYFQLLYLESIVRVADWQASSLHS